MSCRTVRLAQGTRASSRYVRSRASTNPSAAKASEACPAPLTPSSDTIVVPASADQPGFTMVGENVTYADPSFVPYKLREAARRARASVDISKIP